MRLLTWKGVIGVVALGTVSIKKWQEQLLLVWRSHQSFKLKDLYLGWGWWYYLQITSWYFRFIWDILYTYLSYLLQLQHSLAIWRNAHFLWSFLSTACCLSCNTFKSRNTCCGLLLTDDHSGVWSDWTSYLRHLQYAPVFFTRGMITAHPQWCRLLSSCASSPCSALLTTLSLSLSR